ncbi:MAG: TetR/AcrR family transcriptional regulator [Planctomycetota bacterium]|jgi:AcrR family transcriptional regulator|nr:TetR/AcrR family transcriptional regulator [Planctomycetota bacterium]
MSTADTQERLLDAAEHLFADLGFSATSLRAITTVAEVNLAAAHYHFGSKDGLLEAVIARRIGPINEERIERLNEIESRSQGMALPLEEIIEALLAPALHHLRTQHGADFLRLVGRSLTEPGDHWIPIASQFEEVKRRFVAALHKAVPDLAPATLFWRMHFLIGIMCHTLADNHRLKMISGGLCDPEDVEGAIAHLVPFVAAGMRAPAPCMKEEKA